MMNKGNLDISLEDFVELKCRPKAYDSLIITITDTGSLCMNGKLREKLKDTDGYVKVRIFKTEDLKLIAIRNEFEDEEFKFPKNGVIKYPELLEELKFKGFLIPAKYVVEWNDNLNMWVGKLTEVSAAPRVKGRGKYERKNVRL